MTAPTSTLDLHLRGHPRFPWLTPTHTVPVARHHIPEPVILDCHHDLWRVQPEAKVTGGSSG